MDHGKVLALDTPANLKKSTGADTIVTVKVARDGVFTPPMRACIRPSFRLL